MNQKNSMVVNDQEEFPAVDGTAIEGDTSQPTKLMSPQQKLSSLLPLISSDPSSAISELQKLQPLLRGNSLYSPNERLEDVQTSILPLLALDFHLAIALINAPMNMSDRTSASRFRKESLDRATNFLHEFLRRMEILGIFQEIDQVPGSDESSDAILKTYYHLIDLENGESDEDDDSSRLSKHTLTTGDMRNMKIRNFRLKRNAEEAASKLSMREKYYDDSNTDASADSEEFRRKISIYLLIRYVVESIDQVMACKKEIEMLAMAISFEQKRQNMERNQGVRTGIPQESKTSKGGRKEDISKSNKPMEVTRVTQDPITGNLLFKREQLQSNVFKPSWNQPTMTLSELGELEYKEAIRRGERQKESEAKEKLKPRRYEYLVKDGMEDNLDLVDASAEVDRKWDDWKDENPRGSGNKMADRGDRNF